MSLSLPALTGRNVAVLGGGVIGRRVASTWATGGFDVVIRDPSETQREDALEYWKDNEGKYAQYLGVSKTAGKLTATGDLREAVGKAWLVVECIPENLQLKVDTFAELEKISASDAILASNSSSFRSSLIVEKVSEACRSRVLNMHYLMPPTGNIVELMTCGSTDPKIYDFMKIQLRTCGMSPVALTKESTGFLFNRMWAAVKREVVSMLAEEVADPATIDLIWKKGFGANPSAGPCEMMDTVGLDTVAAIEKTYIAERHLSSKLTVDFLEREYISHNKLGKKSPLGGFYRPLQLEAERQRTNEPTLYFLDIGVLALADPLHGGRIIAARSDGTAALPIVEHQSMPDGIDIAGDRLYWTNMGVPSANNGTVQSCKLDGSDVRTVIPSGKIHTPKQLTLDRKEKKIYVCDREGMRVMRCDYDGSELEVLWRAGDFTIAEEKADQTRHCVGITVDERFFYWTQKGAPKSSQGRILRAPKHPSTGQQQQEDPTQRTDVETLFSDLPEPIDLELDADAGFLYWTDRGELPEGNSINRVSLAASEGGDGQPSKPGSEDWSKKHKHEILVRNMHEAIGLKLDTRNGHMYSTDMGGTVYRFNLDGSDRRRMYDEQGAYTGIAISYGD